MMSPEQENKIFQSILKNQKGELHMVNEEIINKKESLLSATQKQKTFEKMFNEKNLDTPTDVGKAIMDSIEVLNISKSRLEELYKYMESYYNILREDMDKDVVILGDKEDFEKLKAEILEIESNKKEVEEALQFFRKVKEN
jgi:excinuclease UvrABC helicase subunit UvrB